MFTFRWATALLVVVLAAVLTGCAAGPNGSEGVAGTNGDLAGFWMGLWHGLIVFITFIISLFRDDVSVYEIHNNGGWYNLGFMIGMMISLGGSARGTCGGRKK